MNRVKSILRGIAMAPIVLAVWAAWFFRNRKAQASDSGNIAVIVLAVLSLVCILAAANAAELLASGQVLGVRVLAFAGINAIGAIIVGLTIWGVTG